MSRAASALLSVAMTLSAVSVTCPVVHADAQAPGWRTASCKADSADRHSFFSWGHQERSCELRTSTLKLGTQQVVVNTENGGIEAAGEDRSDIRVEARIQAWASSAAAAKDILANVFIDDLDGRLHDHGPHSFLGSSGYEVSYRILAPRRLSVNLKTNKGGIDIAHLEGNLRFDTTNGKVRLDGLAGDVHGQTINGGLEVVLTGDRWSGLGMKAETTNGGVTLTIPDRYAAHLEASTVNGRVRAHIPLTIQGDITDHLSTNLNGGGPTIHVETTNGGVDIDRSEGGERASQ